MRIILGKYKGRRIHPPGKLPVRPTTDYAKEGLFNILGNHFDFHEIDVLDLFAGTGSISYEFASRGAKQVLSIESNYQCARFIRRMAEELEFENLEVKKTDVYAVLSMLGEQFDIIFADPPYDIGEENFFRLHEKIFEHNLLVPGGWLIIEHSKRINFKEKQHFLQHRKYGNVNFSIFSLPSA